MNIMNTFTVRVHDAMARLAQLKIHRAAAAAGAVCLMLATSLGVTSCEDYLTETPKYSLTTDNAIRDYNSAKNSVTGIYGRYKTCSDLGGYIYGNLHCMAGMWEYDPTMYNMLYTQTSDHYTVKSIWRELYLLINASNSAIEGVSRLDDTEFPSVTAKNELLGEARCFRAYANLELLWLFGHWFDKADSPYGIIYRDKVSELSNLQVGRISVGESYERIIEDFVFAEENAPTLSSPYRMNREFAKAMHAKLLLVRGWEGDYAEALKLVNELLAAKSAWTMETDLAKLYTEGWDNKENCFSRYTGDGTGDYYGIAGYEFIYAYGLFYDNEFTDIVQTWLEEDERFAVTFGTARAPETWDTQTRDKILTKLYHRGRYEGKNDMYATYPMRYAELYLMKAELLARTNPSDIQGALAPLNEMRGRYTNPVMAPVTGVNTYDELMDAIFKEYTVALFMENETPWFAATRINHNGKPWIYTLKPEVNFSTNQYCWPIPEDELKAHETPVEQNPGLE